LLLVSWRTPDTYHTAGLERGTATSTSTRPGTTSFVAAAEPSGGHLVRTRGGEPRAPGIPPDHQDRAVRLLPRIPLRTAPDLLRIFRCCRPRIAGLPSPVPARARLVDPSEMLVRRPTRQARVQGRFVCACVICVSFSLTTALTLLSGPKPARLSWWWMRQYGLVLDGWVGPNGYGTVWSLSQAAAG